MKKMITLVILSLASSSAFAKTEKLECYLGNSNSPDYLVKFNSKKASVCRLNILDNGNYESASSCFEPTSSGLEIDAVINKQLSSDEGVIYTAEGFVSKATVETVHIPTELIQSLEEGNTGKLPGQIVYTMGNSTSALNRCSVR